MNLKVKTSFFCVALTLVFLIFDSFTPSDEYAIRLRFNLNYNGDTVVVQKTGLLWALSYLGAELPKKSYQKALKNVSGSTYELRLDKVGFSREALQAFRPLLKELKLSEEYRTKGGIDLGEFIVYTLGSSWHYYKITGAEPKLESYKRKNNFGDDLIFPVLNSEVSIHHRLLRMTKSEDALKMAFIAEEGLGDLTKGTFVAKGYEVLDVMKNGQIRVAIYDENGDLKAWSDKLYSTAGKTVKCLWCHESNIQPLFTPNDSIVNFISPSQFQGVVREKMSALGKYRRSLAGDIDFSRRQDHTMMEMLYIDFMEPSAKKLAREWGLIKAKVTEQLAGIRKHDHHEFEHFTGLMHRAAIKDFSPYKTVSLPDSIREEGANEPDIFRALN